MNKIKDKSCVDSQRNFNNLYISNEINFVRDKEIKRKRKTNLFQISSPGKERPILFLLWVLYSCPGFLWLISKRRS